MSNLLPQRLCCHIIPLRISNLVSSADHYNLQNTYHTTTIHHAAKSTKVPPTKAKPVVKPTPKPSSLPSTPKVRLLKPDLQYPRVTVPYQSLIEQTDQYKHTQNEHMAETIIVQFKLHAYDSPVLIGVCNRLRATGVAIGLQCSGTITIPKKIKRFTLLRSPFVDKHSRTQLEVRTYRSMVEFTFPQNSDITTHYIRVIERMQKNLPESVGSKIQIKTLLVPKNWSDVKQQYNNTHATERGDNYDPLFQHPLFLRSRQIIDDTDVRLKNNYVDI